MPCATLAILSASPTQQTKLLAVALAKSLERQLEDAARDRDLKRKHLLRLGSRITKNTQQSSEVSRAKLPRQRTGCESSLRHWTRCGARWKRKKRKPLPSLIAFRNYAASQHEALDTKTPLEKHELLRALGTRVRLSRRDDGSPVVRIAFDIRHLPGAAGHMRANLRDERGHTIIGVVDDDLVATQVELVQVKAQNHSQHVVQADR